MRTPVLGSALTIVVAGVWPAVLPAQDGVGQPMEATAVLGKIEKAAVAAWGEYQTNMTVYRREHAPISRKLQPIYHEYVAAKKKGEDITELQKQVDDLRAQLAVVRKKHGPAMNKALESFRAAFVRSNWDAYDVKRHKDLLQNGLMYAGRQAIEAHPEQAVKAFRTFLRKCKGSGAVGYVNSTWLPSALVAAGQADAARTHVQSLLEDKPEPALYVTLGDLAAIHGKFQEAARHWEQAGKDNRQAQLRLRLVNKAAPEIDARRWVGGKAQPLSAHKGQVCVLDFWATWCGPCRAVMPTLNRFYREYKDKGLEVIGVTRFYAKGYLPRTGSESEMRSGGELVQDMTEKSYPAHLAAFKRNVGIAYPFAIVSQKDFEAYGISGIPTVVVVDTKGKVVFVGVGSASEPMVRAAALRVLGVER